MKKSLLLCISIAGCMLSANNVWGALPAIPADYTELSPVTAYNEFTELSFYGSNPQICYVNGTSISLTNWKNTTPESTTVIANVKVEKESTFRYNVNLTNYTDFTVTCDGTEVYKHEYETYFYGGYSNITELPRYIKLTPGEHQIVFSNVYNDLYKDAICTITNMGVMETPLISVELLEPGSLGTEILYNDVDRIQDVHNLKIKGEMNADDLTRLKMMKDNLLFLDMSEAVFESIPDETFSSGSLFEVSLPEGLKSIGGGAFSNSKLCVVNIPETVLNIGDYAFCSTNITEVEIPEGCIDIKSHTFDYCKLLKNVAFHENIVEIGTQAFCRCSRLAVEFPADSKLTVIGTNAFLGSNLIADATSAVASALVIPKNCSTIYSGAFTDTGYTSIVLPVKLYGFSESFLSSKVTNLRLNSPTIVWTGYYGAGLDLSKVNLCVPDYLVNAYKLDPYWYQCASITGFDNSEIDEWYVQADLTLGARERFNGSPSIILANQASFKINGTAGMDINNFSYTVDVWSPYKTNKIFNKAAENVIINGKLSADVKIACNQAWFFLSLPFDAKVSDIQALNGGQIAIRHYDGAFRAENGPVGSWKDYNSDDIIPAGSGFIINASKTGTWRFVAQDNASKQNLLSEKTFAMPLEQNPSEQASNRGWNLIGNPYACYYNIHKMNYTAPITIYESPTQYRRYKALSLIDDDYALEPNQAFFVQCPDGVAAITFPLDGKQMTSEVTSQQGAPARHPQTSTRALTDLTLKHGDIHDDTRVVLNNDASCDYETGCDAPKFFAESEIQQLYTIGADGEKYAINERPVLDGTVMVGYKAFEKGTYTFAVKRTDFDHIYLTDCETGEVTDLAETDYTFTTDAGTWESRFLITLEGATTSIIGTESLVKVNDYKGMITVCGNTAVEIYNASGSKVSDTVVDGYTEVSLPKGVYIVKTAKKVEKIIVR